MQRLAIKLYPAPLHIQLSQKVFIILWVPAQVFITQTHLAIAMEYAQGGDMFKYICRHKPHCRLLENQARWIFQQLIIGLDYCHSKVSLGACVSGSSLAASPQLRPQLECL